MKTNKRILSTGLVLTVVGWVLPGVSAAVALETVAIVSKTVSERPSVDEDSRPVQATDCVADDPQRGHVAHGAVRSPYRAFPPAIIPRLFAPGDLRS